MDDANPAVLRDVVALIFIEEVRRFERVVAADRDQRVDVQVDERMMNAPKLLGLLGIQEIGGRLDRGAGIRTSRPDDDPPAVANPSDVYGRQDPVVLPLDHRVRRRVVFLQVGVPVEDAQHLDPGLEKRRGSRGDNRVGSGRGSARE